MKLELELLGQALEAEVATTATARSLWGLGLAGAGVWALTPGGRKALRSATVKTMAVGMAAGDRIGGYFRRAKEEGEEMAQEAHSAVAEA